MGAFEYVALDPSGRERKGVLEGDTARQVRQLLRERQLLPVSVTEVTKREAGGQRTLSIRRGVSPADLALFTRQLATLVRAGLPLEEALLAVSQQTEKPRMQSIVLGVRSRVMEGHTLADGFAYVELGLSRGLDVDAFAPGLSFFFDAHIDFFEEIAKFRAARRIWARWMRDVYGAKTERAQWLRFHTQTAGVSLTAQQPYNNIVRTAIEALAAVLGGTNSLHTNALDEVLALPSEKAAEIALRTQQVIMEETEVTNVIDPLGGSWYVEALTDRLEAEAEKIFAKIREMGGDGTMTSGILRGIEEGWFTSEIAEAAFEYQSKLEKGDKRLVGVNCHTSTVEEPLEILRVSHEVEKEQRRVLAERRAARDQAAVDRALAEMADVARGEGNLIPPMLEAVRAEATLGEICDALRAVWGTYAEPARF